MQSDGVHHISKRKRVTQNKGIFRTLEGKGKKEFKKLKSGVAKSVEDYPSEKFWVRFLDKLLMIIAVVSPMMAIPQVYEVYGLHAVSGLSFISWASWALFNLPWIAYGFVHKQKPIVIMYILWFLMNASIAVGILLYS
jgi:uncharacterized protein with PQ loop repeat